MQVDAQALAYAVDLKINLSKPDQKFIKSDLIRVFRADGGGKYYHYFNIRRPASKITLIDSGVSDVDTIYSYRIRYSARMRKNRKSLAAIGSAAVFYVAPETPPAGPGEGSSEPPPPIELGAGENRCPAEFASEVLNLVNAARQAEGLAAMALHPQLNWSAEFHNDWMIRANAFEHTGWYESILSSGFQGSSFGQNIARYLPTPAGVMEGCMNSPGHRANILKSN